MTRYFLSRVKIEGFRGINNESNPLDLRFRTNAVNSVFAANGVGKSSIFEALSYAIRGKVPRLEEFQAQEKPEDYICNMFHSQGTATIEIELTPDDKASPVTILVQRDSSGNRIVTSPSGHPDPQGLLASLDADFTLLDYRTFNRFIDSVPLERGRSFSALLGLSSYSDFRQALQAVSDTRVLNSDFDIAVLRTEAQNAKDAVQTVSRSLEASYQGLTGKLLTDLSQIEQCVADVLEVLAGIELIKDHVEGKDFDQIDFDAIKETIKMAEGGEKRRELEKTIQKIVELESLGQADHVSTLAEQEVICLLLREKDALLKATRGDLFKRLYEAAKALLDGGEWEKPNKCPLCESDLKIEISELVRKQLDQYGQVAAKAADIRSSWFSATWVRRLQTLERAQTLEVAEEEKIAASLSQRASSGELTLADVDAAIAILDNLEKKRTEALAVAKARKDELEKELPPSLVRLTEQVEYSRQFREALHQYRTQVVQQAKVESKLRIRQRWQQFIKDAAAVFEEAEAEMSRQKISAIDAEYKSMFGQIVQINEIVPELQRDERRQNLHLQLSDFYGQSGVSAKALLSESYRNALAISVFLSAALKHKGLARFVVLDDVTSSFDAGNQYNLMEVIRSSLQNPRNPHGPQFIILSHDSLLEKYFDKLGNNADWHHQKLQGWPPTGAVMSQSQDANRLRETAIHLLDAGQVEAAKPLIRQYLEFKLLQIISKVQIPVPLDFVMNDHKKMVSNCLNAINAAVHLHKKAGDLVLDDAQVEALDKIHLPALLGNWVSHYETASTSLAPPVLKGVLKTIDDFAECFRFVDKSNGSRSWYKSLSKKM